MPNELALWLREQRQERSWARPEMARRLIKAAREAGDNSVPNLSSMAHNVYRWERGSEPPCERYMLYYCKVLGISPSQYGPQAERPGQAAQPDPSRAPSVVVLAAPGLTSATQLAQLPVGANGQLDALLATATVAYGGINGPDLGRSRIEREVLMGAHEGSEQAGQAEERGIGEMTLEQFRADVTRLSREFMTAEPFGLYLEMRRVRARMHDVLDRRMWPRDATELYLMLGCLNDLMAAAASDLGYPQAAGELIRAAWAYAVAIDHHPLMAHLRLQTAGFAYWDQPKRSTELAQAGLGYLDGGPNAAFLHLMRGRAAARMGDADTARRAIAEAGEARNREHSDDLLVISGEFGFSRASERTQAGATLIEIPGAEREAAAELEHAIELYDQGPGPGEDYGWGLQMGARADLATARLRAGQLDGAAVALDPVLSLPPSRRIHFLGQRLARTRAELAAPIFRGSAQATDLAERIEDFGTESITTDLSALAGGPG